MKRALPWVGVGILCLAVDAQAMPALRYVVESTLSFDRRLRREVVFEISEEAGASRKSRVVQTRLYRASGANPIEVVFHPVAGLEPEVFKDAKGLTEVTLGSRWEDFQRPQHGPVERKQSRPLVSPEAKQLTQNISDTQLEADAVYEALDHCEFQVSGLKEKLGSEVWNKNLEAINEVLNAQSPRSRPLSDDWVGPGDTTGLRRRLAQEQARKARLADVRKDCMKEHARLKEESLRRAESESTWGGSDEPEPAPRDSRSEAKGADKVGDEIFEHY